MSDTEHPVESSSGSAAARAVAQPAPGDIHDRTFMGDIGLGTRASLFVLIGLLVLAAGGFGLFQIDRQIKDSRADLARAHELSELVARVEADIWRIDAGTTVDTARTAGWLNALYQRPDTGPVRENISTLSEALAQYSDSLATPNEAPAAPKADLTGLEVDLRTAARDIESRARETGILSLMETIAAMRAAELTFIEEGESAPLAAIETGWHEFRQLLSAMPLGKDEKASLLALVNVYQESLTAYAKARLVRGVTVDRGDEILSYMTPSIEGIIDFTNHNRKNAIATEARLMDMYRKLIAAGGTAAVLVVMLAGTMILRSINAPIIAAAEAGRRLTGGNADITIYGLGNEDETGDIARAFSTLKTRLAETNHLKENLENARIEAERGRAASAEAEWLRRDLESMKAELDKGQDTAAEITLLRAVIEATKTDMASANTSTVEIVEEISPAEEPMPLDSISMISRRVADSSQTVTHAALDAERTGILIRNLGDAIDGVDGIEALITVIAEQADLLVVGTPDRGPDLIVMQGTTPEGRQHSEAVMQRFDIIRSAAGKATWAIRDIAAIIDEARRASLDLARSSSAEALEVTTELLAQSENLRGMLDQLVQRMEGQLSVADAPDREEDAS